MQISRSATIAGPFNRASLVYEDELKSANNALLLNLHHEPYTIGTGHPCSSLQGIATIGGHERSPRMTERVAKVKG